MAHDLSYVLSQYGQPVQWMDIPNDHQSRRHVAVMAIPQDKVLFGLVGRGHHQEIPVPGHARFIGFSGARGDRAVASWSFGETVAEAAWDAFCASTSQLGKRMRRIRRQSGLESADDMADFLADAMSHEYDDGALTPVFLPVTDTQVVVRYQTESDCTYDTSEYCEDSGDQAQTSTDETHRLFDIITGSNAPSLYADDCTNVPTPLWSQNVGVDAYAIAAFYDEEDYYDSRYNCISIIGVTNDLRDAHEVMRAIEHARMIGGDFRSHGLALYRLPVMPRVTDARHAVEPIASVGRLAAVVEYE